MSKGKPRHNPDKPQNKYGRWRQWYEDGVCVHAGHTSICNGNPHNCVKVKYHLQAARSNIQKIEGVESNDRCLAWKKEH